MDGHQLADLHDQIRTMEQRMAAIREKDMRPIAAVPYWQRQRKMWAKLAAQRLK